MSAEPAYTPNPRRMSLEERLRAFVQERDDLSEDLGKAVRERLEPGYLYPIEYNGMPRFVPGGDESDDEHSSHHQPIAAFLSIVHYTEGNQDIELSVLCEGNITWRMDEAVSDVSYMDMMLCTLECDRRRRRVDNDTNRERMTR